MANTRVTQLFGALLLDIEAELRLKKEREASRKTGCFVAMSGVIAIGCAAFVPSAVPFGFWQLWQVSGSVGDWLLASLPIFVWAIVSSILLMAVKWEKAVETLRKTRSGVILKRGVIRSLSAGISEEILFRWLGFFACIAVAKGVNFLLGGFSGTGLLQWLHLELFAPVFDLITFGLFHDLLFHPAGWAVGAGLLTANAAFRDAHEHLGRFGKINSWVIGMVMFYLTLEYGLVSAILAHALYNTLVFSVSAVAAGFAKRPEKPRWVNSWEVEEAVSES